MTHARACVRTHARTHAHGRSRDVLKKKDCIPSTEMAATHREFILFACRILIVKTWRIAHAVTYLLYVIEGYEGTAKDVFRRQTVWCRSE
jgi:hypothetical protein